MPVFRIIHYRGLPEERSRMVCGAHKDHGIVTLLYQGTAGGLEVCRTVASGLQPLPSLAIRWRTSAA